MSELYAFSEPQLQVADGIRLAGMDVAEQLIRVPQQRALGGKYLPGYKLHPAQAAFAGTAAYVDPKSAPLQGGEHAFPALRLDRKSVV